MAGIKLVGLLYEAWKDLDRALRDLDPADALRGEGGSSFAWTAAHVTNTVDAWINVRVRGGEPHPLIGQERFRFGGTGQADDWDAIQAGVQEVRETVRRYLDSVSESDLDVTRPYEGSITFLRERGITLRYALVRNCVHHYFHIGEIASKRDALGQRVGDYPGLLEECL